MQLLEVKNDIAKILYSPSEKQLLLADFVLLEDINQSLICQIIGIESSENDNLNIATVRLSLSISKNSNLSTYNGYIPSKDSNVIYISPQEIAQLIKSSKTNLYWGKLSSHSEVPIYLGLNFLRDRAYIRCDSVENASLLNSNIIYNLQFNKKRTVVFDSEGAFRQIAPVSMLTLGKDFKLPLNVQAFEFIASNDLTECSVESRAFIQGILIELEEYAQSLDEKFIPFSLFKKVVDEQARFSSIPELMILRNKILRYEQAGIFAETSSQFKIFGDYLSKSTITTVDVSGVDEKYHKLVLKTLATEINKKCYLIFSANDTNIDKNTISQIYDNSNIRPVITTGYDFTYSNLLKSYCKNMVLFAPVEKKFEDDVYSVFLKKLRQKEFIIYGENTFYMPLVLKLEQFDKNLFDKLPDYEIKEEGDNFLARASRSEKVQPERRIYNALGPKTQPTKQEFADIISQEIELPFTSEEASEVIPDSILQIPDEDFVPEELNLVTSPVEEKEEPKPESEEVLNLDEPVQQTFDFNLTQNDVQLIEEEPKSEELPEIKDETILLEPQTTEEEIPSADITFYTEEKDEPLISEPQTIEEITPSGEVALEKEEKSLPEVTDVISSPEEPKVEELTELKDEISLVEEPEEKEPSLQNEEISFVDEIEQLPEVTDEITFIETPREETSETDDALSGVQQKIDEEISKELNILTEPEGLDIISEPSEITELSPHPTEIEGNAPDDITDDDLDFLDECEISDTEDIIEEEIPAVSAEDEGNSLFEAYIEDNKQENKPEEAEEEDKHTFNVPKVAYKARNDLKDMLEIPEITSEKYNFVEADTLFGHAETVENVVTTPEKTEEETPVIIDSKPDNTLIVEENINDEDLTFLDEMLSSPSAEEQTLEIRAEAIPVLDENINKLAQAIDEFKIDESPVVDTVEKVEEAQKEKNTEPEAVEPEPVIAEEVSSAPVEHPEVQQAEPVSDVEKVEIKEPEQLVSVEEELKFEEEPSLDEVYVKSRITTDETPVAINPNNNEVEQVEIITDEAPVSLPASGSADINLDVNAINESMELASGVSASENTPDLIPVEFIGLTDDDIAVLDSSTSEVLQISEEDKDVDIYELEAASYTEEVDSEGLLEDFIDVPENYEEPEEAIQTEESIPESEEKTPEKPVVVVQEEEEEEPVVITQEEVIAPPVAEVTEEPETVEEATETAITSTLSDAVLQTIQTDNEVKPEEKTDELISAIESSADEEEDSEDKLFADFSIDETPQVRKDKININVENIISNEAPKVSQERRRTVEQSRHIPTPPQTSPQSSSPNEPPKETRQDIPVYAVNQPKTEKKNDDGIDYAVGDWVFHPKYGRGQVESFAHYSNKILFCTILFDNFGRRTLDAKLTGLEKVK